MIKHLEIACAELRLYFNNIPLPVLWHKDLLDTEVNPMVEEIEELAEFKVSNAMPQAFNKKSDLSSFWLSLYDSYPVLCKKASVMFAQLSTTYLCEAEVSDLLTIKTKSRNRLDARNDIRLAQSKTEPNIQGLLERGQELRTNLVNKTDCDIKFFDFFVVYFFFCCCFYFLSIILHD